MWDLGEGSFFSPADVKLLQPQLLERLSFLCWTAFAPSLEVTRTCLCGSVSGSVFRPIDRVCPSVVSCSLAAVAINRSWNQAEWFLHAVIHYTSCCNNSRSFTFPFSFRVIFSISTSLTGILTGIELNLYIELGRIDIFTMVCLQSVNLVYLFIYLAFLSSLSSAFCNF